MLTFFDGGEATTAPRTTSPLLVLAAALVLLAGCFDEPEPVGTATVDGTSTAFSVTESGSSSTVGVGEASGGSSSEDAGTSSESGARECPDDACFTGRCDDVGACQRFVFVTKSVYAPSFGGPSAADAICNNEAAAAGLDGRYAALVTIDGSVASALGNIAVDAAASAVFTLPDGQIIGTSAEVRFDQNPDVELQHPIDLGPDSDAPVLDDATACGDQATFRVWTGLVNGDTMVEGGSDCDGWTGAGSNAGTGRFNQVKRGWAGTGGCVCEVNGSPGELALARLYCFEVPAL